MKPKSHPLFRKTASSFRPSLVACGVALSPIAVTNSHAAIYYWNTTTTGTWATGGNWSDDPASGGVTGAVPGSGDSAVFNQSSVNGATLIQLDADAATTGITFNNTGTTAIQNFDATVRTLTLGSGGITVGAAFARVDASGLATTSAVLRIGFMECSLVGLWSTSHRGRVKSVC